MNDPGDRLSAVEMLAAQTDRDVADLNQALRSQTSLMHALRETQNSMNRILGEQGSALGEMLILWTRASDRLRDIDAKLAKHDVRFANLDAKVSGLDAKLGQHDVRFANLDAKLGQHDVRFANLDAKLGQHDVRFANLDAKVSGLDVKIADVQATQQEILRRLPDPK